MNEHTSHAHRPAESGTDHHVDQVGDHRLTERPTSAGPLMFVLCFALMLVGFWMMAVSFSSDNGVVFSGGLLLAGAAFLIPIARADAQ